MTAAEAQPDKASLRTRILDWNRKQKRAIELSEQAERLLDDGIVDRAELGELFGMRGFHEFLRRTNGSTDPLTGKPSMSKSPSPSGEQGTLWKPYLRASLADKVFDFEADLGTLARDVAKKKADWIRISEEHSEELSRPGAYRPPSWLFSIDDMQGGAA